MISYKNESAHRTLPKAHLFFVCYNLVYVESEQNSVGYDHMHTLHGIKVKVKTVYNVHSIGFALLGVAVEKQEKGKHGYKAYATYLFIFLRPLCYLF